MRVIIIFTYYLKKQVTNKSQKDEAVAAEV